MRLFFIALFYYYERIAMRHFFIALFFGRKVAGPEKISVPGSRFRVLDPTQDPKEPTRRTRDGSDPKNLAITKLLA